MAFNPAVSMPVTSMQSFLRQISVHYPEIPPVIPDGIYGVQTRDSVIEFQKKFQLPPTGEVDNDTWDTIILIYRQVMEERAEPCNVRILPSPSYTINPGEASEHLLVIQSMMLLLTQRFSNLGTLQPTGLHHPDSADVVRRIQAVAGQPANGIIDKKFWQTLAQMYETFVSQNRTEALVSR